MTAVLDVVERDADKWVDVVDVPAAIRAEINQHAYPFDSGLTMAFRET